MLQSSLLVVLLLSLSYSIPQEKFSALSKSEITADSDKNDNFKGNIAGQNEVAGNYKGSGGVIGQKRGTGKATQTGNGDSFQVVGPDGKTAKGTVDKKSKVVKLTDDKGNTVDAKATDSHNANAIAGEKE